jgi:sulfite reductase (NADPH) flavoprotein alpha-component
MTIIETIRRPAYLLPETAPFTPEQRLWLSELLAGLVAQPPAAEAPPAAPDRADNADAPWHDPAMPIAERQALAAGRPLAPRLMAAMAQQDCGQCGYTCAAYANALWEGAEQRANLCVPGGKETLRAVKALLDVPASAPRTAAPTVADAAPPDRPTRDRPAEVTFLGRRRLNPDSAEKETWHVEFDLTGSGIAYEPGDSFGVLPENDPDLAGQVIAALGADPDEPVGGRPLRRVLVEDVCLGAAPDALFQLLACLSGGADRRRALALAAGQDPDGDAATLDVLAALEKLPRARPHPEAFVEALEPLQPRLYSISSSPQCAPGRVSLTVDCGALHDRRPGAAGGRLHPPRPDRMEPGGDAGLRPEGARLRAAGRPGHADHHGRARHRHRAVPRLPAGTQGERCAGRNWLFFGHQREATDFFYADELDAMRRRASSNACRWRGRATGTANSTCRTGCARKGAELWRWLDEGAHLCLRRRQAHGPRRRGGHGRGRRRPWRHGGRRRPALRRRAEAGRPLPHRRLLIGPAAMTTVRTTCPYCGVGCGVLATPDGDGARIAGDPDHPANFGRCAPRARRSARRWASTAGCCIR